MLTTKKTILLALAFGAIFTVSGCSNQETNTSNNNLSSTLNSNSNSIKQQANVKEISLDTQHENKIDWTAQLKPAFSSDCLIDLYDLAENPTIQPSISNKEEVTTNAGSEEIVTYSLNNATAFGFPLIKIEQHRGMEWGTNRLYFNDKQFMNLKNTDLGSHVAFDEKAKTISCEY